MVTDLIKRIAELEDENRKLRSMCKAAAAEIAEVWDAHCDPLGYGPTDLMARLEGRLPPDLYPEQYVCTVNAPEIEHTCVWDDGNPQDCEEAARGISKEDCEYWRPIRAIPSDKENPEALANPGDSL